MAENKNKRKMKSVLQLGDLTLTTGNKLNIGDILKIVDFVQNHLENRILEICTENFGFQTLDGVIFEYWENLFEDEKSKIYHVTDVSKNFIFSAEGFLRMNLFDTKFVEGYLGKTTSVIEDVNKGGVSCQGHH